MANHMTTQWEQCNTFDTHGLTIYIADEFEK